MTQNNDNGDDSIRLIKKYPNRRLYDTQDSRYITLDDAKQMVIDREPFQVVDQKTGEDLTRSILLQIIMEQESAGEPLFDANILGEFIRNNSQASRDYFSSFMQQSINLFSEQQASLMQEMDKALKQTPMDFWMQMTQKNLDQMKQFQDQFFKSGDSEDKK